MGNRVWQRSGFSKSDAILASSLLLEIPMFTVKPSSFLIRSRIWLAVASWIPEEVDGFRHVQEYLINAEFLMVRCVFSRSSIMRLEHLI